MSTRAWTTTFFVAALLIALVALAATSAFGQTTPAAEGGPPHTITVSSLATISSTPDEAVISFGVRTENPDSVAALNENSRTMDAVLAAMKALGIAERDMETTNVRVAPHVINRGTAAEATLYGASTTLSITIHDFDAIGEAIHDGVEAGATRVSGVRFQVGDPATAKKRALQEAVHSARAKADALASAAGTTVTGVVLIRERGSAGNPRPYSVSARTLAFDQVAAAPAIVPPHDIQTKVSITVIWAIG
jgi:uncharacterized protein YggE